MSWEQLTDIRAVNRQDARDNEREEAKPDVCPIDGTVLEIREDGVRNCKMGNFSWPEGASIG